jgi:hypothetical protein
MEDLPMFGLSLYARPLAWRRACRRAAIAVLILAAPGALAMAQPVAGAARPAPASDRSSRRLFQRFVEDAVVSSGGWIEGQYRYQNLSDGSTHYAGPLIAFKMVNNVEAGLRFGFLDVRPEGGPNGSGLSDIDLFAKYRLKGAGRGRFALGTLVKVPVADETEGLGTGRSDLELFAAYRADLDAVSLVANAGFRHNGDPKAPLPSTEDSLLMGVGLLLPATSRLTFVIEGTYESERFKGAPNDARLTVGMQSMGEQRHGGFRGALAIPLSDGAPDYEVLAGAFFVY